MTRLYGYKWTSREGEVDIDLPDSLGFKLWLEKTGHLTNEQWKKGIDRCEKNLRYAARSGDDCWPPSYAEFIGYCDETSSGMYKLFKISTPESKERKNKRRAKGRQECKKLLSIFDD
jgi:hypothetical protein